MNFGTATTTFWRKYVDFSGRARRSEYWFAGLFVFIAIFGAALVDSVVFGAETGVFTGLFYLAIIIPSLAILVRRLHDTSRSAWWVLIGLIPFVGGIVLLVFTLQDTHPVDNQYGMPPK